MVRWRGRAGAGATLLALALAQVTALGVTPADAATGSLTTVPRPDHIVVVVEENRSSAQVVGDPAAPYLTSLAATGALMTQSYALAHPSQPNYLALFSGSTQGVTDNVCPWTFTAPELASSLAASQLSFAGFSEDLPSAGYTGCQSGGYVRRHNPWSNFPAVPASANQPFSAFPTDFTTLPTVAFVVPNLQHDMHDGTVAQGDAWLQSNLDAYAQWARSHNSLLVVTWDEDDTLSANQITTIVAGAGVRPGSYSEHITHLDVLRTIEDAYGLTPLGDSATATPILDIWTGSTPTPQALFSTVTSGLSVTCDGSTSSSPTGQTLSYAWTFGDGVSAVGVRPAHTYASAGTYPVTMTLTDATGLTAAAMHLVTVAPSVSVIAADTWTRTVSPGWGTADTGGPWTVAGTSTNYAATGSAATMRSAAGSSTAGYLNSVSSSDTDLQMTVSADRLSTGNGLYVSVIGRRIIGSGDYRAKVRLSATGIPALVIERVAGNGAETALAPQVTVPGLTYAPGGSLAVRVQVSGANPTTVRARMWSSASPQPTTWQSTAVDATAGVQAPGSPGVLSYLSSGSANGPVTVSIDDLVATRPMANQPPTASFTLSPSGLTVAFDASASSDPEGGSLTYAWAFGDGTTGAGRQTTHTYAASGTSTVTLTVTDPGGLATITARPVTVATADQPPTAAFTSSATGLTVTVDASASADPEGGPLTYAWSFGDGVSSSGVQATHTYLASGTYTVTITVTDPGGLTGTVSHSVPVTAPNQPPTASFTAVTNGLAVSLDASVSTDPEGASLSCAWSFGDGTSGSGTPTTHTFGAAGTYTVQLTVTDTGGLTAVTSRQVAVASAQGPLAADTFTRTVSGGWGAADTGGAWTVTGGATNFTDTGSVATMRTAPGASTAAYLTGVSSTDTDAQIGFGVDRISDGSGLYASVLGRRVTGAGDYRVKVRITSAGAVILVLERVSWTGVETALGTQVVVPGTSYVAGDQLVVRLQVSGTGTTALRTRVWRAGTTQPATWQATAADSTPTLQVPGGIGVLAYLSGAATTGPVTVSWDNLSAARTAG